MSLKVLMIDDDARYLDLLAMMLEDQSYDVKACSNLEEYLNVCSEFKPEILVIDILIGNTNGVELAKAIRMNQEYAHVPVVFMSAWTGAGNLRLPSNSVKLFKPFTLQELVNSIEKLMARSRKLGTAEYED